LPKVTHVKAAQQRYEMVPDIDPATAQQRTAVVTGRDGKPKKDKHGQVIVRCLTIEDRSRPRPNHLCEKCGKEIIPGEPYKSVPIYGGPQGLLQLGERPRPFVGDPLAEAVQLALGPRGVRGRGRRVRQGPLRHF
jgi:hypothetical protein